ncbi:MAG: pyruvate formate-lyase-activating protein [Elusimicrobiota bacterium]
MTTKGRIHSIETLGALDGPGLRCVVFFQGCPLRCIYCHNPDTWAASGGTQITPAELVERISKYKLYFGKRGGVTFSGGEPLFQPEFLLETLKLCKSKEIHATLDTSGYCETDAVNKCLDFTDLVILDIKHYDDLQHKKITGKPFGKTLEFLKLVFDKKIPLWIRHVVVPEINDTSEDIAELVSLIKKHAKPEKVELIGYHTMGIEKWKKLGLAYTLNAAKDANPAVITSLQKIIDEQMKG